MVKVGFSADMHWAATKGIAVGQLESVGPAERRRQLMPDNARHILIVDDEQDIRSLIQLHLQDKGYLCYTANSAEAAMEVINTEPVELALLDIIMPEMTGLSLFKHIRETFPDIGIVFVTSVDDMNLAFDCVKEGAADFIIKSKIPFRLLEAVGQALARRDAAIQKDQHLISLEGLVEHQAAVIQHRSQEITALNRMFRDNLEGRTGGDNRAGLAQ